MKANSKKKPKKKRQPVSSTPDQDPHEGSSFQTPEQAEARRAEVYKTLTQNPNPTPEDIKHAKWCRDHDRVARSHTALSQQMGQLGIAGHLPRRVLPSEIPRFDAACHQQSGPPSSVRRNTTFGLPPASGKTRWKSREERNWYTAVGRTVQRVYSQEARAQHFALAKAGHSLKQQLNNGLKETTRLQQNERDWRLEMERALIEMWHCPLHYLLDQSPEFCIGCENNQGVINRLERWISTNDDARVQLSIHQAKVRERMDEIDSATWGARMEAERATAQLDYRVTRAGEYKEVHSDDSPYSTDCFADDEEQEAPLVAQREEEKHFEPPPAVIVPPCFEHLGFGPPSSEPPSSEPPGYHPPDYESLFDDFGDASFFR